MRPNLKKSIKRKRSGIVAFRSAKAAQKPRGFTLVEMLVAVALVVLMMLMFAQVFQSSAGLVSNQKGMAELDQTARMFTILLRGDLKQRTFVDVVPFVANQDTTSDQVPLYDQQKGKGYEAEFRKGFFSISENDPDNNTDDVLHLTIRADSPLGGRSRLPYSGKSRLLRLPSPPPPPPPPTDDQYLLGNPDQPEFDDGQLTVNDTGSSNYAEVCWFLRNGNLYRRILLIRDPYYPIGPAEDPEDSFGDQFIPAFYDRDADNVADNFWRDFDYSAYWEPDEDPSDMVPTPGLKFHTTGSLANSSADPNIPNLGQLPRSLGNPLLRFGNSIDRGITAGQILGPREYILDGMARRFIGRFTTQETSHPLFNYPGQSTAATDAHNFQGANPDSDPAGRTFSLNPSNGVRIDGVDSIYRRGEDLVASNVHSFDIKVWDDLIGDFVDLGHDRSGTVTIIDPGTGMPVSVTVPGWFNASRRFDPQGDADPNNDFGNRYDTWHPSEFMLPDEPPYAPYLATNGVRDPNNFNGLGSDDEVWLEAIRIQIRYFDQGSGQMRDLTLAFRLNRSNSTN